MSYRKRRQSIYLQRNSISRTNSYDAVAVPRHNRTSLLLDSSGLPIPLPNLKTMKVYKGYEFVTFKSVEILPPLLDQFEPNDSLTKESIENINDNDDDESSSSEIIETRINSLNADWIAKVGIEEVSQSEACDCLYQHVNQKCCHGSKAAREMSIIDVHHSLIVRYTLESVCERRQLCWTFEPFVGHDSPPEGSYTHSQAPPDDPWKISVDQVKDLEKLIVQLSPPPTPQLSVTPLPPIKETDDTGEERELFSEHFQSESKQPLSKNSLELLALDEQTKRNYIQEKIFQDQCVEVTVPGTMSIHSCHVCSGVGRKRCISCVGSGSTRCDMCEGVGYFGPDHHKSTFARTFSTSSGESTTSSDYCWRCRGRGRLRCDGCTGIGMTICGGCAGSGQIKCFIKMIVTLTNHHNSVIIRDQYSWEIPFDQIKLADGDTVLDEDGLNLHPTSPLFNDDLIMKESHRLIKLHRRKYLRNSKLIWQRHRINVIPVCRSNSSWRGNHFRFYVFSRKPHRRCYVIDYPQRCCFLPCCCCCCSSSCCII